MSNANISKEDKHKAIEKIATTTVDIKGLGYYALGSYRKDLSEDEIKHYSAIYEKYFLKTLISRLLDYSDQQIEVLSAEILNEKYTMVKSKLLSNGNKPEIKIEWRVYTKNPEMPLIRDLIVEGLSLARTQKEEFSSIIQNNNGKTLNLFTKLEEFINN